MKDVYIYGNDDGISWVEKGVKGTTLSTNTSEWSSGVRFTQHPDSQRKVYVNASTTEVTFTLDKSEANALLESAAVQLSDPSGGSSIELRADGDGAAAQTTRWHSGYVQRK